MKSIYLNQKQTLLTGICQIFLSAIILLSGITAYSQNAVSQNVNRLTQRPVRQIEVPQNLLRLQQITVPRLVGRNYDYDEVVTILDRVGLQIGEAIPVADNQNVGMITAQQPAAGQSVFPQTRVNVSYGVEIPPAFSSQPDLVVVPRYVGLTIERAEARMPNDRLTMGQVTESYSEEASGIVIGQFPEPEMEVDDGTPVSLEVSMGPPPVERVEVPLLTGLTLREAAEILQESGLIVGELNEETSEERETRILNQNPQAGSIVLAGSPVSITYSVPEELISVPDVRRMSRNEAIPVLKEAGLNFYFEYTSKTKATPNTIVEQAPIPNSRVPAGTDVLLYVADKKTVPEWIYWSGGILVAAVLGGFAGSKIKTGKKKKISGKKDISVHLKAVWDPGKQTIETAANIVSRNNLHLKFLPDLGKQTLKIN